MNNEFRIKGENEAKAEEKVIVTFSTHIDNDGDFVVEAENNIEESKFILWIDCKNGTLVRFKDAEMTGINTDDKGRIKIGKRE